MTIARKQIPMRALRPEPALILHLVRGKIISTCELTATPAWAKPILRAAIGTQIRSRGAIG